MPHSTLALPAGYRTITIERPAGVAKVLGAGLGRASRAVFTRSKAGAPPPVALALGPHPIDREALAAFQTTVGYLGSDRVPATWVHVMAFPLHLTLFTNPTFPLPPLGMVHVNNSMTQLRTIHADEHLTLTCWAANLSPHKRGATIDICATAHSGTELVWHGVSTYLAKGGLAPAGATASEKEERWMPTDLPGHHLWTLHKGVNHAYAEVSGDSNPIHTNLLAAKAFGFRAPIVHGMYTASRALAEVPHGSAFTWDVDFYSPIIPPTKVVLEFGPASDGDETVMRVTSRTKTHLTGRIKDAN